MSDSKNGTDSSQLPSDIEALCALANWDGASYFDFSTPRQKFLAQKRERRQAQNDIIQVNPCDPAIGSTFTHKCAPRTKDLSQLATSGVSSKESSPQAQKGSFFREMKLTPSWGANLNDNYGGERFSQSLSSADLKQDEESVPQPVTQLGMAALQSWPGLTNGDSVYTANRDKNVNGMPCITGFFSLSGGVGKTSMIASLGRALAACRQRVLLVDTSPYSLLPYYFGADDQKPGVVRTFLPPSSCEGVPIQVLSLMDDELSLHEGSEEGIKARLKSLAEDVDHILIDLSITTDSLLQLSPLILVPVLPDMSSVVTLNAVEVFFQNHQTRTGEVIKPYYLLNQFEDAFPLHNNIKNILQQQLGDYLVPLSLSRQVVVSEAFAEGMTVMDYAPNSTAASDIQNLANWLRSTSASALAEQYRPRWSEQ